MGCFGKFSCYFDVVLASPLRLYSGCFLMGCVGKGHSWTSSMRVSSHGERKEKGVECMGLYLPPLACMVVK